MPDASPSHVSASPRPVPGPAAARPPDRPDTPNTPGNPGGPCAPGAQGAAGGTVPVNHTPLETKECLMPDVNEKNQNFTFEWKPFLIYGAIWIAIFVCASFAVGAGRRYVEQQRRIQEMFQNYNGPARNWDGGNDIPFERRGSDLPLEQWVANNLPASAPGERNAVAGAFDGVAEMIEGGTLAGVHAAFAECVARLQPVAARGSWLPFLQKLTVRVKCEPLDAPENIARAFRKIARGIRSVAAPLKGEGRNTWNRLDDGIPDPPCNGPFLGGWWGGCTGAYAAPSVPGPHAICATPACSSSVCSLAPAPVSATPATDTPAPAEGGVESGAGPEGEGNGEPEPKTGKSEPGTVVGADNPAELDAGTARDASAEQSGHTAQTAHGSVAPGATATRTVSSTPATATSVASTPAAANPAASTPSAVSAASVTASPSFPAASAPVVVPATLPRCVNGMCRGGF